MEGKKTECKHGNVKTIKLYRQNFPFGKNSKARISGFPKKFIEVCSDCGKVLCKYKPVKG